MRRVSSASDSMVALFLLGVLAFNAPMLALFNTDARWFGMPLLYVYLFMAWAALIMLMAFTTRRPHSTDMAATPPQGRSDEGSEN